MEERVRSENAWHAKSLEEVFDDLDSGPHGLDAGDASARLERHGRNTLEEGKTGGLASLILGQLTNPLILMLIGAAGVSVLAGHGVDAIVILSVVVLNTTIGVVQESRAEKALEALRNLSAPHARVLRGGVLHEVQAAEIVPGDVVVLETGDRIPADLRLIVATELSVDESALTGESEPVSKAAEDSLPADCALADRTNMGWTSTAVTGGRGRGVVVRTGMETVIGQIAGEVQGTQRRDTPLQRRLARLSLFLGIAAISSAVAIFIFGLLRGFEVIEMLLFAVAAAVSSIPEGLPAVVSVVLAIGVQRMSDRQAILRRLPAVETLGSTTVVCTDKTGTITRNQMTVRNMWVPNRWYDVEGEGFDPAGAVLAQTGDPIRVDADRDASLRTLLTIGAVSNNALLLEYDGAWEVQGNPTDGALLVVGEKAGIDTEADSELRERIDEIPFSSSSKYAATLSDAEGGKRLYVKGAPERIISFCSHVLVDGRVEPLDDETRSSIQTANLGMADHALRVVAGASRDLPPETENAERSMAESELVFVGLWGLLDPPRDEAIRAIEAAQGAGVRVVMITGDHANTATAIAKQVGIASRGETTDSGGDLERMSDEELRERVSDIAVYARVAPEHKLRIVQALKANGEIVAMTGDGVNDAPALKASDIGIAMGMTGTEVAKEASDMVLGDDNFATIVRAIEEGRVIYSNLRRVVAFLLSTAAAEVLTLFAALALGFHLPLTAVMILWINLVADGITTIPLGLEPPHGNALKQPPRPPAEGVLTRRIVARLVVLASIAATVTMLLFARTSATSDLVHAQTVAFTTLAAFEWFKSMTWRTSDQSVFRVGFFSNRWLLLALAVGISLQVAAVQTPLGNLAFGTRPLSIEQLGVIMLAASSVLVLDEIGKVLVGHRGKRTAPES